MCGKYPELEILAHIFRHSLLVKNVEGESTEANDLVILCRSKSVA